MIQNSYPWGILKTIPSFKAVFGTEMWNNVAGGAKPHFNAGFVWIFKTNWPEKNFPIKLRNRFRMKCDSENIRGKTIFLWNHPEQSIILIQIEHILVYLEVELEPNKLACHWLVCLLLWIFEYCSSLVNNSERIWGI